MNLGWRDEENALNFQELISKILNIWLIIFSFFNKEIIHLLEILNLTVVIGHCQSKLNHDTLF